MKCGVNASELRSAVRKIIKKAPWTKRLKIYARFGINSGAEAYKSWWEADHILPVAEGGGGCGLENYQTLCLWCHKEKSAGQKARTAKPKKPDPQGVLFK